MAERVDEGMRLARCPHCNSNSVRTLDDDAPSQKFECCLCKHTFQEPDVGPSSELGNNIIGYSATLITAKAEGFESSPPSTARSNWEPALEINVGQIVPDRLEGFEPSLSRSATGSNSGPTLAINVREILTHSSEESSNWSLTMGPPLIDRSSSDGFRIFNSPPNVLKWTTSEAQVSESLELFTDSPTDADRVVSAPPSRTLTWLPSQSEDVKDAENVNLDLLSEKNDDEAIFYNIYPDSEPITSENNSNLFNEDASVLKYSDGISIEEKITFDYIEDFLRDVGIQRSLRDPIRQILHLAATDPHRAAAALTKALDLEVPITLDQTRPPTTVRSAEMVADPSQRSVPTMPTTEELRATGKLYSQAFAAAEAEGRKYTIIDHLRAVWMPWIEAGQLDGPTLREGRDSPYGDRSAYDALRVWRRKEGNELRRELGYEIPSKSDLVDRRLAGTSALNPGERSAKDDRALRYRLKKEERGGRD
jgi:hypothetical protein